MSQSQNKILALVLVVCMIFSMVPIYSMIAYGEDSEQIGLSEEIDSDDSGEDSDGLQGDFEGSDVSEDSEGIEDGIEDSDGTESDGEGVEESDEELGDLDPDDELGELGEDVGTPTDVSLGQSGIIGTLGIMPFSLGFTISGTVTLDGIELSGVTVELYDSADSQIETTTTDSSGYYEFLDQQNETYKVKVVYGDGYEESAVVNDTDVVVDFSLTTPTAHVTSWSDLVGQFESAGDSSIIEIPAGTVVYIDGELTLPSGSYTITGDGTLKRGTHTGRLITVGSGRTLILDGIEIDGESDEFSTASQSVVYGGSNSSLQMTNGASIINNYSSENGAAIQFSGTSLTIGDGCLIDGNSGYSAIYMSNGTLLMDGARVSNNSDDYAINITGNYNGTEIKSSTISDNYGGIIALSYTTGEILIKDCTISDNGTTQYGGGLYLGYGHITATVKDCLIENNKSTYNGGGIYSLGLLILDNTYVVNNKSGYGGGIHSANSTIENAYFIDNEATTSGGGIYSSAELYLKNVTVTNNKAPVAGGLHAGTLAGQNCIITDNEATTSHGGGIMLGLDCDIDGFDISNNTAVGYGGGIYMYGISDTIVKNSTITNNISGLNGGGIYFTGGLNLKNTDILNNESTSGYGGGIGRKNYSESDITMVGGKIDGNEDASQNISYGVYSGSDVSTTILNVSGGAEIYDSFYVYEIEVSGLVHIDARNNVYNTPQSDYGAYFKVVGELNSNSVIEVGNSPISNLAQLNGIPADTAYVVAISSNGYAITEQDYSKFKFNGNSGYNSASATTLGLYTGSYLYSLVGGQSGWAGDDYISNTIYAYLSAATQSVTYKVKGTVTLDGNNLSGATVELYESSTKIGTTTTNSSGYYEFTNKGNGSYTVKLVYGSGSEKSAVVNNADATVNFSLTTPSTPTYKIKGTVKLDNTGLSGTTVELYDSSNSKIGTTTTDSTGYYEFGGNANGSYTVKVVYDSGSSKSAVINNADTTVNFNLTSPQPDSKHNITGTVEDDKGNPLPGLSVDLIDSEGTKIDTTTTDNNGNYEFTGLDDGDYTVESSTGGNKGSEDTTINGADEVVNIVIAIPSTPGGGTTGGSDGDNGGDDGNGGDTDDGSGGDESGGTGDNGGGTGGSTGGGSSGGGSSGGTDKPDDYKPPTKPSEPDEPTIIVITQPESEPEPESLPETGSTPTGQPGGTGEGNVPTGTVEQPEPVEPAEEDKPVSDTVYNPQPTIPVNEDLPELDVEPVDDDSMTGASGNWLDTMKKVLLIVGMSLLGLLILGIGIWFFLLWYRRVKVFNNINTDEYKEQEWNCVYKDYISKEDDGIYYIEIPEDIITEKVTDEFEIKLKSLWVNNHNGETFIMKVENNSITISFIIDKNETLYKFNYSDLVEAKI